MKTSLLVVLLLVSSLPGGLGNCCGAVGATTETLSMTCCAVYPTFECAECPPSEIGPAILSESVKPEGPGPAAVPVPLRSPGFEAHLASPPGPAPGPAPAASPPLYRLHAQLLI